METKESDRQITSDPNKEGRQRQEGVSTHGQIPTQGQTPTQVRTEGVKVISPLIL